MEVAKENKKIVQEDEKKSEFRALDAEHRVQKQKILCNNEQEDVQLCIPKVYSSQWYWIRHYQPYHSICELDFEG